MLDADLLQAATGCTAANAARYADPLSQACARYQINTTARLAAFLAQIGHESGSLRYVSEIWGPTAAQKTYEGRKSLGNTQPGDGERYKGHGLIQVTGRANHAAMRDRLRIDIGPSVPDFEADPEQLTAPLWAAFSAAAFWFIGGCNGLADSGDFEKLTRKINGGTNGLADRMARWEVSKKALSLYTSSEPVQETPDFEHMPAGEAPGWEPPQEKPMAPFVAAALSAILGAAPELIDTFKGTSKSAARNADAAKVVVGIAKETLGASNEQEVVERIQSDPAAADAVRKAIQERWFEIHKAAEKSMSEAREFSRSSSEAKDVRTVAGNFTFIEFLTLVFLLSCWSAIGLLAAFSKISEGTLDNIIMLAVVASITGVREFWYGSSLGSRQKDELGARQ